VASVRGLILANRLLVLKAMAYAGYGPGQDLLDNERLQPHDPDEHGSQPIESIKTPGLDEIKAIASKALGATR